MPMVNHYLAIDENRNLQNDKTDNITICLLVLYCNKRQSSAVIEFCYDNFKSGDTKHSLNNMKGNLIMTPDNAQAFERSIDMLDSSIKEMRRVAHNMMPEILVRYGLNAALNEFCNEIDRSGVIHVSYQSISMDKTAIEQTVAVTIYHIVQELVNNAIKHAAAKNVLVQVHMAESDRSMTITVEDDGKGFDTAVLGRSSGMGWNNIHHRVEFLKGKIDVSSAPGKGTSVLIEIGV